MMSTSLCGASPLSLKVTVWTERDTAKSLSTCDDRRDPNSIGVHTIERTGYNLWGMKE